MKIIIATPLYPPDIGGPATFAALFEEGLAKRGIAYETVPFSLVRGKPKIIRHLSYASAVFKAARRSDIVLALDPVSVGFPALLAARLRGARFFLRVGGDYAWEQGMQRFGVQTLLDEFLAAYKRNPYQFPLTLRLLVGTERYVARHVHAILVQSSYLASVLERWGIAPEYIHVAPNAALIPEMPERESLRHDLGWEDSRVILSAGRLVPWKGFEGLIKAAAIAVEKIPNLRLVIAGDGPELKQLKDAALRAEESSKLKIHFEGAVPHDGLLRLMRAADVFALNTGYEGFSHQVLEAMAVGVPVVTTDIPGNADLARPNETALVVPYGYADTLAARIEELLSDAALVERLSRAALDVARRFTPERMVEETLAALSIPAAAPAMPERAASVSPESADLRVLMISGDSNILWKGTAAYLRLDLQRKYCKNLTVLVRQQGESKFAAAWRMRREGASEKWDVVTAQDPVFLGHIAWHIARRTGAKLELQMHTGILSPAFRRASLGNRLKARFALFHLRRANGIRVVSERIKQSLRERGIRAPVSVLPIFIDIETIRASVPADIRKNYPQFDKLVLVAARLEREKHIERALRALPAIIAAHPRAGLMIAGTGSERPALERLAENLGVTAHVVFLGFQNDVFSLYKNADCLIAATADYEGFGAAAVEALAAGCPVVSDDVGVAREAGAVIAEPGELAQKVIDVLNSGQKGELKLTLPTADEWARQWCEGISRL